jgi:hypothetical protein
MLADNRFSGLLASASYLEQDSRPAYLLILLQLMFCNQIGPETLLQLYG